MTRRFLEWQSRGGVTYLHWLCRVSMLNDVADADAD